MTKLGTKGPNWVRNYQIENNSGYEFNKKIVRTELGTKWPRHEMTRYQNFLSALNLFWRVYIMHATTHYQTIESQISVA